MKEINAKTVVNVHELCLDICPFQMGDRNAVCAGCPVRKKVIQDGWRFLLPDAVAVVKSWTTYISKFSK